MDIQEIKQKLARVGLPLHGTDEELEERAIVNGLVEKRDRATEALLADKTKEDMNQLIVPIQKISIEEAKQMFPPVTSPAWKEEQDRLNRSSETAVEHVKRGRPKKGK